MVDIVKFHREAEQLVEALRSAKRVLITAPGAADGDSVGSQLALRRMFLHRFPHLEVRIVNDEPIPHRYRFLPDVQSVGTPETCPLQVDGHGFDVGVLVDGGVDRVGRLREAYDRCPTRVFIDHHIVSAEYPYTIRMVEPRASATTELIYFLSQTEHFQMPVDPDFAQQIYLGLIFDTGFFRHSNTTPEVMELGAKLIRTGFDFTRVGERGLLERSYPSLQLLSATLHQAETRLGGRVIWSAVTQQMLSQHHACNDDREGIIDQLLLTEGIEVALLFFELPGNHTRISLRSHGRLNVAQFARSLTEHGGGHQKAAGALLELPLQKAEELVLGRLDRAMGTNS